MKNFFKSLSGLAWLLGLSLSGSSFAQTNTQTYFAELNNTDRRDVSVSDNFAPYGNKTELNRYGDDGSAAIVDASGVIIWRTSSGVYRVLGNTQVAKPLFVTNSECIVWSNAFAPIPSLRERIEITYFRVDSESGAVRESTVPVDGNIVMNTARVTTSTIPFTLVTTNVEYFPPVNNVNLDKNFFVYRLTYDTERPQLLAAKSFDFIFGGSVNSPELIPYFKNAESVAAGADGSYIVRLVSEFYEDTDASNAWEGDETFYLWVRSDGSVKPLYDTVEADIIDNPGATIRPESAARYYLDGDVNVIRPVALSNTKFVFDMAKVTYTGTLADGDKFEVDYTPDQELLNYSRSALLDQVVRENSIDLGKDRKVPDMNNFTLKGVDTIFLGVLGNLVTVYRLQGDEVDELFEVTLPNPLGTDLSSFVQNSNDGSESFAIRDANNGGVIWLHGQGADKYTLIPEEKQGMPLFVTPGELVVWTNSFAESLPDGSLPPALVTHYGALNGVITQTTPVQVISDATDPNAIYPGPVRGSQVFSPFPFTQDPSSWKMETGEKIAANTLRIRRYQLLNPDLVDEDADGIRGGLEKGPFYVIPGAFTFEEAAKDAARRGGKLATISSPGEYQRMSLALDIWKRQGYPVSRNLPTPLWIGLQYIGGAWQWQDGSDPAWIASNWQPGQPAGDPSLRYAGLLGSTNQWLNYLPASPAFRRGYLLELPVTSPSDTYEIVDGQNVILSKGKDTDGDGASDYDELFRLLTDPNVPNFGLTGGIPLVDFKNPLVNGSYEGFLTDVIKGPISSFTLKVTSKGGFTGSIKGATGSGTVRGNFASNGIANLSVKFGKAQESFLSLLIAPDPVSGIYRVSGSLTGNPANNAAPLVTELRRAAYGKSSPTPDAGSYTISIPASTVAKEGQPNGDGYLVGTVSSSGLAKLRGYSSEGHALSWSGNVVEGDFLSFFSVLGKNLGYLNSNLFLRKFADVDPVYGLVSESDVDGNLLVVRNATLGSAGYSFRSSAYGSLYHKVSYAQLPSFNEFAPQPNNSILKFVDGIFSGQDVVSTWTTSNQITTPKTQTRSLSAKINSSTGEMTGSYNYNDPAQGYVKSSAKFGGVVLQKSGEVRGYYTGGTFPGQVLLQPNLDGSTAPVNLISPRSKDVGHKGLSYQVYVTSSEPWKAVVMPADTSTYSPNYYGDPTTWVSVTPSAGEGNGVVTVTVYQNNTWYNREATVMIAGLKHKIEQGYGFGVGSDAVTISPVAKAVPVAGANYLVQVQNYNALTSSANPDFDFYSPVDWVTVDYTAGNTTPDGRNQGIAVVTVAPNPGQTNGYISRTVDITIGGLTHRIVQAADNPYDPLEN
jgi:hypothetical protein